MQETLSLSVLKTCTQCGCAKPLDAFYKKPSGKYGRSASCSACNAAKGRAYWDKRKAGVFRTGEITLTCKGCHSEFTYVKTSGALREYCDKRCSARSYRSERAAMWRDRERVRTLARYGLSPAQFEQMLAKQSGMCAICGTKDPGGKHNQWSIDHDHACCSGTRSTCGQCVRGLLCNACNRMLGHARDDRQRLAGAIEYLNRQRTSVNRPV